MFYKIFFILLFAASINLTLSSRSKSLPEDAKTSNNGLQRNRNTMKNMYNALKNMLPWAIKRSNKQIDEEDNQEYWMRLKKNLPKLQTSFPTSIIKRIIQKRSDNSKKIDYMRLRKIKRSKIPSHRIKRSKSCLENMCYNPTPCVPVRNNRFPCIEVSQDFFDDDDFDGPTAFLSLYGPGGDFDPRLLKQMNFADPDNNGKDWEYYMRL